MEFKKEHPLYFESSGRLVTILGKESVSNPSIALIEAIKNTYDADAKEVDVIFKEVKSYHKGEIIIQDDGHGMTREDIKERWMKLATDNKLHEPFTKKYKRRKIGEKGIARFAFSTLGLAGEVIKKNINDFPEGLLTAFLGGARERRDKEALFDMISKTVPESDLDYIPVFFEKYAELVNRYLSSTIHSHRIVSCLIDMTRRLICPDIEKHDGKLIESYSEITIKLARDAIHFISKLANIPEKAFSSALED